MDCYFSNLGLVGLALSFKTWLGATYLRVLGLIIDGSELTLFILASGMGGL